MLHKLSTLQDVQGLYDWFEMMRNTQPVWLDESSGCWHVFRYEEVNNVITDHNLFSSERRQRAFPRFRNTPMAATSAQNGRKRQVGRSLLVMDPPQHRQYRNLVTLSFSPRALSRLSERIATITQELLDQVRSIGRMDPIVPCSNNGPMGCYLASSVTRSSLNPRKSSATIQRCSILHASSRRCPTTSRLCWKIDAASPATI